MGGIVELNSKDLIRNEQHSFQKFDMLIHNKNFKWIYAFYDGQTPHKNIKSLKIIID